MHQIPHYEVLCQIPLQMRQSPDGLKLGFPRRNRASDGKIHAIQKPLRQHPRQEIRIQPQRFHPRPKSWPAHRAIGTRHQPHLRL